MAFVNYWASERSRRGQRDWRPSSRRHRPGRFYTVQSMVPRPTRYTIIGASHIRRLNSHLRKKRIQNFGLAPRLYDVLAFGEGGLRVIPDKNTPSNKCIGNSLRYVSITQADVVLLCAGSNDVGVSGVSPTNLANALMGVAGYCLEMPSVKRVVICLLFPRKSKVFNKKMNRVNSAIRRVVRLERDPRVWYWSHEAMWGKPKKMIIGDGTHLNPRGNDKFFRSLRGHMLKNHLPCRF